MYVLRWFFLSACLGCVSIVLCTGRWEGRLTVGNETWIVNLDRAPVWAPPPVPSFAKFREIFKDCKDFPGDGKRGRTIRPVLKLDWMIFDLLLYLWSVTAATGLLYLALRGERRDLILHLGLWTGIGLTAAAAACFGLWLMIGGWGPPAPEFFGTLGLVAGVLVGLGIFKRGRAEENLSRG